MSDARLQDIKGMAMSRMARPGRHSATLERPALAQGWVYAS